MRRARAGVGLLLGLLLGLGDALPARALAHGGIVTADGDFGPFHLVVQVTPTLETNQVRLTVVVSDPGSGEPISDAQVMASAAASAGGGGRITLPAGAVPAEAGQPGFYDGLLTLAGAALWQVTITVQRAGSEGATTFPVNLGSGDFSPILWLAAVLPLVIGAAVVLYFWRASPRAGGSPAPPDPAPPSRPG
ncbi:MAG TPA: hypothetical protein VM536_07385 [Chloroflexia bacterium]|nr:hypothetical protein [Chloroflexia bacterium]